MPTHRLVQFFEDERGTLSMSRLVYLLSFVPASYVLVNNQTSDMLAWYLGAYAAAYVGGKLSDGISRPKVQHGD